MASHNPNRRNHLYSLRKIRGFRQKHLAMLLGYRGTSMISRFEAGTSLPTLKVALLMEIVLGAHVADIYVDLRHDLEHLALRRAKPLPDRLSRSIRGRVLGKD
jgi:transcriptional regulator with XRE-family HTH domain